MPLTIWQHDDKLGKYARNRMGTVLHTLIIIYDKNFESELREMLKPCCSYIFKHHTIKFLEINASKPFNVIKMCPNSELIISYLHKWNCHCVGQIMPLLLRSFSLSQSVICSQCGYSVWHDIVWFQLLHVCVCRVPIVHSVQFQIHTNTHAH